MQNQHYSQDSESSGFHPQIWKVVISSSIGNALEWYDIIVYGSLAFLISKLYFPATDPNVSLMIAFATFGVSFVTRPLGAIVIGSYADRKGRKAALTLSILLMMLGTLLIAVMPTYEQIGIWATVGVVLARLIQGFSAGGEFGSSTTYLVEHTEKHKGFFASWQMSSQGLSLTLAPLLGYFVTHNLSAEDLSSWGWRCPFLFGLLIGPVGYYIRQHLDDAPQYLSATTTDSPVLDLLASEKMRTLIAIGLIAMGTVGVYTIIFTPTYAIKQLGLSAQDALGASVCAGLILMLFSPLVGHLSDRFGRIPILLLGGVFYLLFTYPLFKWLSLNPSFMNLLITQAIFGIFLTLYVAPVPALLAEIYPIQIRGSGMSLSYNIGVMLFGGFSALIISTLIQVTGDKLSISYYVMGASVISVAATIATRKILGFR